jgi:hypothetical protein
MHEKLLRSDGTDVAS